MKLRSLIVGLVFLSAMGFVGHYIYSSNIFLVSEVEWEFIGNEYPQYYKSLQPILDEQIRPIRGQSLWTIPIYDIEKNFETLSWVQKAHVTRGFPNKIVISLDLKKISANLLKDSSHIQPVAEDGIILEPAKISNSPSVPILVHPQFKTNQQLRFEVVGVLSKIPKDGIFNQDSISEVHLDKENSFVFLLKDPKTLVALDSTNSEIKIARVNKVLKYLDQSQIKSRVIDANFSKKVLVKLRNHD